MSAFGSDPERGALRVAVDSLGASALEPTLLRELGNDPRSGIEVVDASEITREPYARVGTILSSPRDMLVIDVLDDSAPHIPYASGFFQYRQWLNTLTERGATPESAEHVVTTVAAAQALGIDIIATGNPQLLRYFSWKNALPFAPALALCGLYLRHRNAMFLCTKDDAEWHIDPAMARKLTVELLAPALVDIEQACMKQDKIPLDLPRWLLANSVLTRLTRALKARDELHFLTQTGESHSASEGAAFYLDYFVLCAFGALDALARLVNDVYRLKKKPEACGWHKTRFLTALRSSRSELAKVADSEATQKPLEVLRLVRNLIHEVGPEPLVEVTDSRRDKHPLNVFAPDIVSAAAAAGGDARLWGLSEAGPFGGAYVAPDVFVEKATSELFRLMDALTRMVELDRLPSPDTGKRRAGMPLRGIPFVLGEQATQRLILLAGVS